MKWAVWKGRRDGILPEDLSAWTISAQSSDVPDYSWFVAIEPPRGHKPPHGSARPALIKVPAWATIGDGPIVIDHEPNEPAACPDTVTMALPAPIKANLPAWVKPSLPAVIEVERKAHPVLVITVPDHDYRKLRIDPLRGLIETRKRRAAPPAPSEPIRVKQCRINTEFRRSIARQMA